MCIYLLLQSGSPILARVNNMLWYLVFEFPIINGTVKCQGRGLETALHLLGSSLSLQVDRCIDIIYLFVTLSGITEKLRLTSKRALSVTVLFQFAVILRTFDQYVGAINRFQHCLSTSFPLKYLYHLLSFSTHRELYKISHWLRYNSYANSPI